MRWLLAQPAGPNQPSQATSRRLASLAGLEPQQKWFTRRARLGLLVVTEQERTLSREPGLLHPRPRAPWRRRGADRASFVRRRAVWRFAVIDWSPIDWSPLLARLAHALHLLGGERARPAAEAGAGGGQAGAGPLADNAALELGQAREDVEPQLSWPVAVVVAICSVSDRNPRCRSARRSRSGAAARGRADPRATRRACRRRACSPARRRACGRALLRSRVD